MANPPASFLAGFRAATGVQQMRERSRLLAEDRNDRIQAQMIGAQVAKKIDAAFGELEVLRGEFKELDLENDEEFRRFQRKQQITRAQAMTTAIGAISQGMAQAPGNPYLREVMQSQMQNLTAAFQSNVGATARIEQALVGRERTEMEQKGVALRETGATYRAELSEAGEDRRLAAEFAYRSGLSSQQHEEKLEQIREEGDIESRIVGAKLFHEMELFGRKLEAESSLSTQDFEQRATLSAQEHEQMLSRIRARADEELKQIEARTRGSGSGGRVSSANSIKTAAEIRKMIDSPEFPNLPVDVQQAYRSKHTELVLGSIPQPTVGDDPQQEYFIEEMKAITSSREAVTNQLASLEAHMEKHGIAFHEPGYSTISEKAAAIRRRRAGPQAQEVFKRNAEFRARRQELAQQLRKLDQDQSRLEDEINLYVAGVKESGEY